ncbi:hypothetical protein AC578_4269 [Pseudocercospora eumusae]|uniref:Uncharacterized protein n=1 Tax=Pseudocercospora eumusae TaxID=321146 RepID=A0A139HAP3_9PEZI|nr:hypothetical protein AC578_4269 [Pseudocercospora eumusae]
MEDYSRRLAYEDLSLEGQTHRQSRHEAQAMRSLALAAIAYGRGKLSDKLWPSLDLEGSTLLNYFSRLRSIEWRIEAMKHPDVLGVEEAKTAVDEAERSLPEVCLD